jgi:Ni,Fe-hydrogenase III component G
MRQDEAVARIQSLLGDVLLAVQQPSSKRLYIEVDSQAILDTTRVLFNDLEVRLQTATGVDGPEQIEILYHWALDRCGLVVTVRTRVDRNRPEIASITAICPGAEWIEREMWELLGISFRNHPDLRHLLLLDDWPEGKYPLRRDYQRE